MVDDKSYVIPTSYEFSNVDYAGQTTRLAMFSELKAYMTSSRSMGVELSADKLLGMYANDVSTADWATDYATTKQMKSKTFEPAQADFDLLITELAAASSSTVAGEPGISGIIESNDGAKSYLIGANGLDHAQLIEKGLMGALLYYQSTAVYFGSEKIDSDNVNITEGRGTEMEHAFDEAFGYFGVPINFPTDKDGLFFWGDYTNNRDAILNCNQTIMDAFLKGRAAISNKDIPARDEAIAEVRKNWELIAVGSALHYINAGIENFEDKAIALHGLSESIGFIYSLKFNEKRSINNEQIDALLVNFAGSADFAEMNLYNTTIEDLITVKDELAAYFNLTDKKDQF